MESNWCYCTVLRRNAFNERHVHICKLRSLCHDCILLGFLDRLFAVRGFFVGSDPASQTLIVHEVFMIKTHTHVYAYIYVYTCVSLYFPL